MTNSNSIDYSSWSGLKKLIAASCDKDKNGKLEKTANFDEISIFNATYEKSMATQQEMLDLSIKMPTDAIHSYAAETARKAELLLNGPKKDIDIQQKLLQDVVDKQQICADMYKKWSGIFPKSPLKLDFYEYLYDVISTLKIEIKEEAWDKEHYTSPIEQTMDEVIAIFAGESQLNPKAKNGIYHGIFQLANPGLTEAKQWAKKHKDVPGMKNINKAMTLNEFRNASGRLQLDYLVAYIGKCKEYSKIGKDESITPGQLWAMIKYPFKGKNRTLIIQKTASISNVFKKNRIPQG